MAARTKVFISYKRNREPDEPLARRIFQHLKANHDVFIDTEMQVGEKWAERIRSEIAQARYLIVLLTADSIQSQMVVEEIRIAEAIRRETQSDFPSVLPIRVAYTQALPYELGSLLNQIMYASWQSVADTPALLTQLEQVIAGKNPALPHPPTAEPPQPAADIPFPSANPRAPLEAPEGTMAPASPFYVERLCDRIARDEQTQKAYTLTIKGPRQMGKSSLLGRVMSNAIERGMRVAFLDFQSFGQEAMDDAALFYPQFCYLIEDALDIPFKSEEFMQAPLTAPMKCKRFMERHVLPACGEQGLILAMDEADRMLDSHWRSDFFGMLRAWHNLRSTSAKWGRFSLAMAISTEPALLIDNISQSPFNVGRPIDLEDFTLTELRGANLAHGSPLGEAELVKLHQLVTGQPYLCRKALYLLCQGRYGFATLEAEADSEGGPFGDHLRAQLIRLGRRPEVLNALATALSSGKCPDEMRMRLMAGGLIVERNGRVEARCPLYQRYFTRVLRG